MSGLPLHVLLPPNHPGTLKRIDGRLTLHSDDPFSINSHHSTPPGAPLLKTRPLPTPSTTSPSKPSQMPTSSPTNTRPSCAVGICSRKAMSPRCDRCSKCCTGRMDGRVCPVHHPKTQTSTHPEDSGDEISTVIAKPLSPCSQERYQAVRAQQEESRTTEAEKRRLEDAEKRSVAVVFWGGDGDRPRHIMVQDIHTYPRLNIVTSVTHYNKTGQPLLARLGLEPHEAIEIWSFKDCNWVEAIPDSSITLQEKGSLVLRRKGVRSDAMPDFDKYSASPVLEQRKVTKRQRDETEAMWDYWEEVRALEGRTRTKTGELSLQAHPPMLRRSRTASASHASGNRRPLTMEPFDEGSLMLRARSLSRPAPSPIHDFSSPAHFEEDFDEGLSAFSDYVEQFAFSPKAMSTLAPRTMDPNVSIRAEQDRLYKEKKVYTGGRRGAWPKGMLVRDMTKAFEFVEEKKSQAGRSLGENTVKTFLRNVFGFDVAPRNFNKQLKAWKVMTEGEREAGRARAAMKRWEEWRSETSGWKKTQAQDKGMQ